jgi:hypothetical protein
MGSLINNAEFGSAVRTWLRPGDEAALMRYKAALDEAEKAIQKGSSGILAKSIVSGVIGTAADMASDAAAILATTTTAGPSGARKA